MVDIQALDPTILVDLKYATRDNFVGEQLYPRTARGYLQRGVAEALARVQARLRTQGYGLKVWDGYRPLAVQKKLWQRFPVPGFVANPAVGSNHNRGAAVDVTLVDLRGRELVMPTRYDEFSERAHRTYQGGAAKQRQHREILQEAMLAEGFTGLMSEWWHFDFQDPRRFPILDIPFEQLAREAPTPTAHERPRR